MGETKNVYGLPAARDAIKEANRSRSPAHTGPLEKSVDFILKRPTGTPVVAAGDGIIVDLKDGSDTGGDDKKFEQYGNFVEIEHVNGEYSEYEHLQKGIPVKIGQRVKKGQVIAYSGATGWLAGLGPHLHFMVGRYGKTIDDYETLEPRFEEKIKIT
jgi:murein DD-endopeptidase MepM/ murein hydrolase activator NlpD